MYKNLIGENSVHYLDQGHISVKFDQNSFSGIEKENW